MSASGKDSFSSLLAQAEQLKKQQQQRKSYEAMIADIGKETGFGKVNSYSHEAKVNKWLAEQSAVLAEQPLGADYLAPRRRRPRVDPSLLDWKKLTGDENVSVINRVTGKKLTGPKAPTLKRLGQWLVENPMYDIDPKWADLVKERGNLSHDLQKRVPSTGKKGMPGRPPLLSSPTGSSTSVSTANINTSLASNLSFPSLAGSGLGGINTNLLSGLSGLGQFDSKNPLLMPFAGLPNVNALSSMGGLGNLSNMNLFANLAGLGLPGLGGMDPSALAAETTKSSNTTSSSKGKSQKPTEAHSSSKTPSSSASSIPTSSPFPFFFPNPSLLYTPLGLGGLTPFSLQPGMSAYDTLAQQCGLLNGNLNPAASPNSSKSGKSSNTRPTSSSATATSTSQSSPSQGQQKMPKTSRDAQLQQLLLPPDTHLLESISKVAGSLDASLKYKKDDKRKALESLRGMLPTDFSCAKDKKMLSPGLADFGKLLEGTASCSKKSQEQQMKEAIEQLSKNNADFMARAFAEEQVKTSGGKRSRESISSDRTDSSAAVEEDNPAKRPKESHESAQASPNAITEQGVDIETLLPPSTVVKSATPPADCEQNQEKPLEGESEKPSETEPEQTTQNQASTSESTAGEVVDNPESPPKKSTKRTRSKRKSGELPLDHEAVIEKKNLRSSASRSAAAAAARAAAEQAKLEAEIAQKAQENDCA